MAAAHSSRWGIRTTGYLPRRPESPIRRRMMSATTGSSNTGNTCTCTTWRRLQFAPSLPSRIHLARSRLADGGRPGTWYKYYQGTFTQPGLGGLSTPIDPAGHLNRSWVSYNTYLNSYLGFGELIDHLGYDERRCRVWSDDIARWLSKDGPRRIT